METYRRDWAVNMKTSVTIRPVLQLGSGGHHRDLGGEGDRETTLWSCLMATSHPKKGKD